MAKIRLKIVACDGSVHAEWPPVEAAGRIGVQAGEQPVVWKDLCQECLNLAVEKLPVRSGPRAVINGGKKQRRRSTSEMRVMQVEMRKALKAGMFSGPELCKRFDITAAQLARTIEQMDGVRKIGMRNHMRYTMKKGKVKNAA